VLQFFGLLCYPNVDLFMISFMSVSPGWCFTFPLFTFYIYSSQLAVYVEGGNLSVTVGIVSWYFVVCLLSSRLLCGGGLYVEVLGLSAAGELRWDGFFFMAVGS